MYCCKVCGEMFLTQREADLCTPQNEWLCAYGLDTADPFYYLRKLD